MDVHCSIRNSCLTTQDPGLKGLVSGISLGYGGGRASGPRTPLRLLEVHSFLVHGRNWVLETQPGKRRVDVPDGDPCRRVVREPGHLSPRETLPWRCSSVRTRVSGVSEDLHSRHPPSQWVQDTRDPLPVSHSPSVPGRPVPRVRPVRPEYQPQRDPTRLHQGSLP